MKVSDLYAPAGPFVGQELYIVGTGPSMRAFDVAYLKSKTCILLNDAARYLPLGPIAFSNHLQWIDNYDKTRIRFPIVKARLKSDNHPERDDNHVKWHHPLYYCFSYRDKRWDKSDHFDIGRLWNEPCHYWNYPGGSAAIFACQFAALAGASAIILVGCDCMAFGEEHYLSRKLMNQKHRNKKMATHNYDAYAAGLLIMKHEIKKRFNIPLMTLTPFCGLGRERSQYKEIIHVNDQPKPNPS